MAQDKTNEYIGQTESWYEDDGLIKGQIPEIDQVLEQLYDLSNTIEIEKEENTEMTYYEYQEAMADRMMHELRERELENEY